jgi:hypothetical protein
MASALRGKAARGKVSAQAWAERQRFEAPEQFLNRTAEGATRGAPAPAWRSSSPTSSASPGVGHAGIPGWCGAGESAGGRIMPDKPQLSIVIRASHD